MNWTMKTSAVIYNDSSKSLQYREGLLLLLTGARKIQTNTRVFQNYPRCFFVSKFHRLARLNECSLSLDLPLINYALRSLLAENVNNDCHVAQQRRFAIWLNNDWSLLYLHLIGGVKFRVYNSIAYGILDGLEKSKLCYLLQCVRLLPTNFHNFWHTLISYGVCANNYMKIGWQ